jgi:hypothetical protein
MARWPAPVVQPTGQWLQKVRLPERRQPKRISLRSSRARRIVGALIGVAAAAGVLVAVAVWSVQFRAAPSAAGFSSGVAAGVTREPIQPDQPAVRPEARQMEASEIFAEIAAVPTVLSGGDGSVLTATSPSQRLRLQMILARTQATWQSKEDEFLDRMLAERTIEPSGDLQQWAEPLMAERAEFERLLLDRFDIFTGEQQTAAIELLGCIGGEASVPRLLYCSHKPAAHAPAIRALLRIADTRTLAWLAGDELDPGLQEEIMAALSSGAEEQSPVFALSNEGVGPCFKCGLQFQR